MDDLKTLHDVWDDARGPSPRAAAGARAALLARARGDALRLGVRLAVARSGRPRRSLTAVTVTENLGGTRADVPDASAAPVLERAAVAAVEKPFVARAATSGST